MRGQLLADLLGAHPAEHTLAYILVPDAFPHRAGTVRVMNSADLTTLGLPPPRSARRILEGLKRIPLALGQGLGLASAVPGARDHG